MIYRQSAKVSPSVGIIVYCDRKSVDEAKRISFTFILKKRMTTCTIAV